MNIKCCKQKGKTIWFSTGTIKLKFLSFLQMERLAMLDAIVDSAKELHEKLQGFE